VVAVAVPVAATATTKSNILGPAPTRTATRSLPALRGEWSSGGLECERGRRGKGGSRI
jgi:hypothetical protein